MNIACMVGLARKGLHVLPAVVLLPYVACAFRQLQRVDALQESMFSSSPLG